ncbi:TlpA family protein disulfide reductase [Kordia zhangzhouensis]|uniref:TlpA family protein disulfide reductase n=1 Tax=Kordia zhangzhouensis TaxID=1620405 RepID=UPI000628FB5C|nr:TlpA disulfide reductase family protein [Kordia zhangzhouensis]
MKKILLLIAGFAIVSCTNEPKVDYALFSGKITNPKGEKVVVTGEDFEKEITLNEDGTFADTLRVDTGYYTVFHGRNRSPLFVAQGHDLTMTTDGQMFIDSLSFKGNGANENNYLVGKLAANKDFKFQEVYASEEAEFMKIINEKKAKAEDALQVVKELSADFVNLEKSYINYEYLADLSRYPMYHAYYAKKEDYKASEEILKPLNDLNYDNANDFKNFEPYKQIVLGHYMQNMYQDSLAAQTLKEIQNLQSQNIKNELAAELVYTISPSNENVEEIYNTINAISDDNDLKEKVTEKYNKVKELATGKVSPTFEYENHKGGTTSLKDLEGKYVYIDVWATWCGPCIGEIPSLKKVEEEYHDKNIEFVSISIDQKNAYETWRKMVEDKELGGIQLMADNAWQSKFVTDYAIEGIPRFILIDPQGNIVNADAPRPSSPKLIELFNELKI